MLSSIVPSNVFQNLIVLSAEPPPDAKTPWLWGFHAKPLTAAQCWLNLLTGIGECLFHIMSLLSFPPEARDCPSKDHFNPHTYWVWPSYTATISLGLILVSCMIIVRSLDPLANRLPDQDKELTLALCPNMSITFEFLSRSQIYVTPWLFPTEICEPIWFHVILVMVQGLISQNLITLLLLPFHMYKEESRATERIFCEDHYKRLR